ncbi:mast/stem cell growth factor receptor Kit-like [Hydra vulgaris]|uniref:Mast/stem cell growth factor receptor Kit-like n=1 Tax=Hydra vulgaris TaxID=6087 RepID=A0ABM4CMT3_HYDVU
MSSNGLTCLMATTCRMQLVESRDDIDEKFLANNSVLSSESNNSCASDWFEFASYCYYFQSTNDGNSTTWEHSYLKCLNKGGNLLSINDETENAFILSILKNHNMNKDNYWIGLTDHWYNSLFFWSDNTYSQYIYSNFNGLYNDDQNCVIINKSKWETKKCGNLYGYICKRRRGKNCNCDEGWTDYRKHCYFVESTNEFYRFNWYLSLSSCLFKGGNLLSINNQEENRFIQNSLIKDNNNYWIGFKKLQIHKKFVWSDNTYTQFFNWIGSEKIYYDEIKNCIEMNSNGWSSKECNTLNGFICKKVLTSTSYPANNKVSVISVAVLVPVLTVLTVAVVFIISVLRFQKKKSKKSTNLNPYTIDQYTGYDELLEDEWEIYPKDIIIDKKVGEGAFGTVFIAKLSSSLLLNRKNMKQNADFYDIIENTSNVAVKLVKNSADLSEFNDFYEEMNLMKEIGYHKNIVNLIGCSTIKKPLCLIVEYMEHGDLLNFLRKRRTQFCASNIDGKSSLNFMYTPRYQQSLKATTVTTVDLSLGVMPNNISLEDNGTLTPDDLLSFAWQVASGMEFLTCSKLVHRDLAARNILVGAGKIIKISDFGLTRKTNGELIYMSKKKRRLPVKWMSVEAIFDHLFTSFSDVWAYGVVLFEIVTLGGTPYPTISNRELLSLLKSGYRMEKPENCSETMYEIMLQCWNKDPLQRPTFTILREYFDKVMSQGDCYLNFEFDENTPPSFLPYETDNDGDNIIEDGVFQSPAHVKSIEEIKMLDESILLLCDRYASVK